MLKAILFDLDNTLIAFNEDSFFQHYFMGLYPYFKNDLTFEDFSQRMLFSTGRMIGNDGTETNLDVFIRWFSTDLDISRDDLWQRFDLYYSTHFNDLQKYVTPIEGVTRLFRRLLQMKLKLVIATNPMFPKYVQQYRVDWSGLGNVKFDLITSVENSYYCKPNLKYYESICDEIQVAPQDCLMVGNDPVNDLAPGKLGMKTYLITDTADVSIELSQSLAASLDVDQPKPDFIAPLSTLLEVTKGLIK